MPPLTKNADLYLKIMQKLSQYPFHNLDFKKIIDKKVWAIVALGRMERLKRAFRNVLFLHREINYCPGQGDILFVRQDNLRADHKRNYEKVIGLFSSEEVNSMDLVVNENMPNLKLLIARIINTLSTMIRIQKCTSSSPSLGLGLVFSLAAEVVQIEDFYRIFAHCEISEKCVVVFHDASSLLNLICQGLKGTTIKTVTLQHGLYIEWNYPGVHNTDYENTCADYFFSWGPATQVLIENYNKRSKVMNVGHPFFIGYKPKLHTKQHRFGVVLCAVAFREDNRKLIAFAEHISQAISVPYMVKLHPADNESYYFKIPHNHCERFLDKSVTIMDYVDLVDFSITNPSSLLYQLLFMGHMTYKFGPAYANNPAESEWISISDLDSFLDLYKNMEQTAYLQSALDFVSQYFTLGDTGENYRNAFHKVLADSFADK